MINFGFSDVSQDQVNAVASNLPSIVEASIDVINKFGPLASTVKSVLEDPALPDVLSRIDTLRGMSGDGGGGDGGGVGLSTAVPILDAYIFYKKYPWAPFAIAGGVILLIALAGRRSGMAAHCPMPAAK